MRTWALAAAIIVGLAGSARAEDAFKVIVNASNEVSSLSRRDVSQLFLKKTKAWSGGVPVLPVEPADPRLRSAFAREVHGKALNALKSYWNQVVFSGRDFPPPERASEDAVVEYVRSNPGAVGYVSPSTGTGGVKVVSLRD